MEQKKRGRQMDMLNGSLWDKILLFALPLAATSILQQLFNSADLAVVGQLVGKEAMAAVGAVSPLIHLLVGLFVGMSLGTNVIIARAIGQKNEEAIKKTIHTSLVAAVIIGIIVTLFGELFAIGILDWMKIPEDVFALSSDYIRVYLLGVPVILLYNFEAAIFRASGNTKTPLLVLTASGILNVLMNLFFVAVLRMAADGVALATVLSNLISAVILFVLLLRSKTNIKVSVSDLRLDWLTFVKILKIGVPSGLQNCVFSLANIIIQSAINSLGTVVVAASSAGTNVEAFALFVLAAFGQTCTTFVGQNSGAGQLERCRRSLYLCLLEGAIATAAMVGILLFFGRNLLGIFSTDTQVIELGYQRLVYIFITYIFSMPNEVLSGYLRGYGKSLIPALISIFGICGTRLFWIFCIFPQNRSFATIMTAYPLSVGITAVIVFVTILIIRPSRKAVSGEIAST